MGQRFPPSQHQGAIPQRQRTRVVFNNPDGVTPESRRLLIDRLNDLHKHTAEKLGDADVDARIAQYEMSYRMQSSVPGVMDLRNEKPETFDLYGPDSRKAGHVRRELSARAALAEKGVKFIQLYHQGWDQHGDLPTDQGSV